MTETQTCRGYGDRADCDVELEPHLMEGGLCPKCMELQRMGWEREHQMTRDPQVEPW